MKNLQYKLLFLCFFTFFQTSAQDTISITLTGEMLQDAYINNVIPEPFGYSSSLISSNWTYYGEPGIGRSLINYQLVNNTPNLTFLSGSLFLYHNPNSAHIGHSDLGGDNTGMVVRVTEDWTYETVSWLEQPGTTNTNHVLLPAPGTSSVDFTDIDITPMLRDMLRNPERAFGLMIKLQQEDSLYRSLVFASTDHEDESLWPRIEMKFLTLPPAQDTTINFRNSAESGQEVSIQSNGQAPAMDTERIVAEVSHYEEGLNSSRSFIEFDLTSLVEIDSINRAELNLFHLPNAGQGGHTTAGKNDLIIQRITSNWSKDGLNWENMPETTIENQVFIGASIQSDDDYLNIDVTDLLIDMLENPEQGHGLMIRLADEDYNNLDRRVVFASAYHQNPDLRPRLDIISLQSAQVDEALTSINHFKIFPNPASGTINLQGNVKAVGIYRVFNANGSLVKTLNYENRTMTMDISSFPKGIYFVQLQGQQSLMSQKLIVN